MFLGACGNDSSTPGDDDGPPDPTPPAGLTFYEDVAPLLAKHCVGCHRPDGAAPFSLITADDVLAVDALIPDMVTTRQMPPWGADNSGACNTFRDARWMTDGEIATIVDWLAGDRALGDPALAPALPPLPPGLSRVDATAAMPVAYTPDAALDDDYRCFIVDPGIASDAFLTGFEVRPGEPAIVHHILMFQLDTAAAETTVADLDAQTAGPGYTCFGGVGAAASLLGVWAPGVRAATYPEGTGLAVKGGRKIVLQIHYHRGAMPLADQTAVDLRLEPTVPEPSFLYLLAAPDLYVPPGQASFTTTNQYQLPGFLGTYNVWGVFPHMHTLGRTLRVEVDHAGQPQCMVDVPRWDFNWQQGYFYDGPPKIAGGGDMLRISCTHDTTSRTEPVTWGEGTNDEMCLAFMYVSQY
ncbi:MAG TPA: hypothetical protein VFQ53_05605 [Kofleriaceae bacterium]|nr:hypothetical protein [Kofleriaceae bacterium]